MSRKKEYDFKTLYVEIPNSMHRWLKETAKAEHMTVTRLITRLIVRLMIEQKTM